MSGVPTPGQSEAAAWLEQLARRGQRPGPYTLDLIREILDGLGRPQAAFRAVHVAGTRGKGSTCALVSAALHHAGHSVGLSTSPHLVDVRERIRLEEQDIDVESLLSLIAKVKSASVGLEPSYFEVMTAVSFLAFAEAGVDVGVMEVGLGGRLDATNVCQPIVTAIARLGLEHCDRLGDTLSAIAGEKAGIIKPGVPVVLGLNEEEAVSVVTARAAELVAPLRVLRASDVAAAPETGLVGAVQAENAALAWAVLEELAAASSGAIALSREQAESGMAEVRWAARQQRLPARGGAGNAGFDQILDVAHDEVSIRSLLESLADLDVSPTLVFSCLKGKDLPLLARIISESLATRGAAVFVPEIHHPRAREAADVVAALRAVGMEAHAQSDVESALVAAQERCGAGSESTSKESVVVVFGSFAVVGEALRLHDPTARSVVGGPNP